MADAYKAKNATPIQRGGRLVNAMSVDVEDYFHAQALGIGPDQWDAMPQRTAASTHRILDMFGEAGVKATFFTLGWVAERHPELIRRITAEGHELASHGWNHTRVDKQTPEEFRADLRRTRNLLEDAGGQPVRGYRAATFSISHRNPWAFEVLAEEGYAYSSSVFPISHDYYGMPSAPRFGFYPLPGQPLEEYPMSSVTVAGRNLPCSGGGYFRLLPYFLSRWAMRQVNAQDLQPCIFYFHPWEVDPGQPRIEGLSAKSRLRHYTNLDRMEAKIRRLLQDFAWDRMDRVLLAPSATEATQ